MPCANIANIEVQLNINEVYKFIIEKNVLPHGKINRLWKNILRKLHSVKFECALCDLEVESLANIEIYLNIHEVFKCEEYNFAGQT